MPNEDYSKASSINSEDPQFFKKLLSNYKQANDSDDDDNDESQKYSEVIKDSNNDDLFLPQNVPKKKKKKNHKDGGFWKKFLKSFSKGSKYDQSLVQQSQSQERYSKLGQKDGKNLKGTDGSGAAVQYFIEEERKEGEEQLGDDDDEGYLDQYFEGGNNMMITMEDFFMQWAKVENKSNQAKSRDASSRSVQLQQ